MLYASVDQFRTLMQGLPKKTGTPNAAASKISETDERITQMLTNATGIINEALMPVVFDNWPIAPFTRSVMGNGTQYLLLPPFKDSSITSVSVGGNSITSYQIKRVERHAYLWRSTPWAANQNVDVTAIWGYGPPPDQVVEVCLELAVNMWRSADRGYFSDAVGVDPVGQTLPTGGVVYSSMLTKIHKMILESVKRSYRGVAI